MSSSKRIRANSDLCHICKLDLPPVIIKKPQPRRTAKAKVTSGVVSTKWIQCDVCKHWCHIECCGLSSSDYKKLTSSLQFYKCLSCCITSSCSVKALQCLTGSEEEDSTNRLTLNSDEVKTDKSGNTPGKCASQFEPEAFNSSSQDCQSTGTPDFFLGKLVQEGGTVDTLDSSIKVAQSSEHSQEKEVKITQNSDSDKILIVDNIPNPTEFSSSRRILKEIHNFFPDTKIDFAYSLAKGGVAIHTSNTADRDLLLYNLPEESFGGGRKHPPKGSRNNNIFFIKGVDTSVELHCLSVYLQKEGVTITDIRRLTKRVTGKPTQVVRVQCDQGSGALLMKVKLYINNRQCSIEKERTVRVIRCYNCQRLGHIARHCNNARRCEICAESHSSEASCSGVALCANCNGSHPSYSSDCAAYVSRYAAIANQYSKYQHLPATPAACSTEITY